MWHRLRLTKRNVHFRNKQQKKQKSQVSQSLCHGLPSFSLFLPLTILSNSLSRSLFAFVCSGRVLGKIYIHENSETTNAKEYVSPVILAAPIFFMMTATIQPVTFYRILSERIWTTYVKSRKPITHSQARPPPPSPAATAAHRKRLWSARRRSAKQRLGYPYFPPLLFSPSFFNHLSLFLIGIFSNVIQLK